MSGSDLIFASTALTMGDASVSPEAMRQVSELAALGLHLGASGAVDTVPVRHGRGVEDVRAAIGRSGLGHLDLDGTYALWFEEGPGDKDLGAGPVNHMATALAGMLSPSLMLCRGDIVVARVGVDGSALPLEPADYQYLSDQLTEYFGVDMDAEED